MTNITNGAHITLSPGTGCSLWNGIEGVMGWTKLYGMIGSKNYGRRVVATGQPVGGLKILLNDDWIIGF